MGEREERERGEREEREREERERGERERRERGERERGERGGGGEINNTTWHIPRAVVELKSVPMITKCLSFQLQP